MMTGVQVDDMYLASVACSPLPSLSVKASPLACVCFTQANLRSPHRARRALQVRGFPLTGSLQRRRRPTSGRPYHGVLYRHCPLHCDGSRQLGRSRHKQTCHGRGPCRWGPPSPHTGSAPRIERDPPSPDSDWVQPRSVNQPIPAPPQLALVPACPPRLAGAKQI